MPKKQFSYNNHSRNKINTNQSLIFLKGDIGLHGSSWVAVSEKSTRMTLYYVFKVSDSSSGALTVVSLKDKVKTRPFMLEGSKLKRKQRRENGGFACKSSQGNNNKYVKFTDKLCYYFLFVLLCLKYFKHAICSVMQNKIGFVLRFLSSCR